MRFRSTASAILLSSILVLSGSVGALHPNRAAAASTTLIYGLTSEPDTLNPLTTQLIVSFDILAGVFDSFFNSDPHGKLLPALALSDSHTPDGLTWTFHLRHGVKWADGQPFTSADVAYTYKALFDKKNNVFSTTGWDQIDKFSTPDDYTVVCHIKHPYAPFEEYVGITAIIPKHIYGKPGIDFNKTSFNRTPFGTGPYMVSEWKTADHITLVPNPNYWGHKAYFQKVIAKIVPNKNTLLVQLGTGDVDMGRPEQSQVNQAKSISGKRLDIAPSTRWWHIDLKQWGFLREKAVRQALDYATPKEAILKGILKGLGQVAYADAAPLLSYYYNPNVPKHPFNLTKAAQLLAGDGFTKGSGGVLQKGGVPFAIDLWAANDDAEGQRIEQVLKSQWGKIGVAVTLRSATSTSMYGPNGPQFTKNMTGIGYTWNNSSADPDDSFYWNSTQIPTSPTGAGGNDIGYFNKFDFQKQIDALTNAGLTTVDAAKRRQIYFQIQNLLADEVPVIFMDWQPVLMVLPNSLAGYSNNPFNGVFWNIADWHE